MCKTTYNFSIIIQKVKKGLGEQEQKCLQYDFMSAVQYKLRSHLVGDDEQEVFHHYTRGKNQIDIGIESQILPQFIFLVLFICFVKY